MTIQTFTRPDTLEHSRGTRIEIISDGEKFSTEWHISSENLTAKIKSNPGAPVFNEAGEKKGHLALTTHGEYLLRKYRKPKNSIMYAGNSLNFHAEVKTIDQAQEILDACKSQDRPAACLHKYGLHQVYTKF